MPTGFNLRLLFAVPVITTGLLAGTAIKHSLVPAADTSIGGDRHSAAASGSAALLHVGRGADQDDHRLALVRFDLSALKAAGASDARLVLHGRSLGGSSEQEVKVYGLTEGTWSETTLTPDEAAPALRNGESAPEDAVPLGTLKVPASEVLVRLPPVDVTAFVDSRMKGDKIVAIALVGETPDGQPVVFGSREHAGEVGPRLSFTDPATKTVLHPVADAYVQNGALASVNFGSADLKVRENRDAAAPEDRLVYLKFNRSSVPDAHVKRATLRLFAKEVKVNRGATNSNTQQVFGLTSKSGKNWSESSLNWYNSPNHHLDPESLYVTGTAVRARALGGVRTASPAGNVAVDITDYLNDKRPSLGTVGFMIMAEPNSRQVAFATREGAADVRPYIEFSAVDDQGKPVGGKIFPGKDTHVRSGAHAETNFGTEYLMLCADPVAGDAAISYLMFDATAVPKVPGVDTVVSATLHLHAVEAAAESAFRIYTLGTDFDETGTTWRNNPELCHDTIPVAGLIPSDLELTARRLSARLVESPGRYYEFDVTDFLNDRMLAAGETVVTFMVQGGYSVPSLGHDIETIYGSREDIVERSPELVIEPGTLADNLRLRGESVVDEAGLLFTHGAYALAPNLAQAGNDRIMTCNGYQYATYYNAAREVRVARRPVDGTWESAKIAGYRFESNDTHNYTAIGISPGDGTIHLAFDHHRNALNYVISETGLATDPESATWTSDKFSAVRNWLVDSSTPIPVVSYAQFITQPDGAMMLNFSEYGTSRRLHRYSSGSWSAVGGADGRFHDGESGAHGVSFPDRLLVPRRYEQSGGRRMYSDEFVYDPAGGLHFSWNWREDSGLMRNHDLLYAYSPDNGDNWYSAPAGTHIARTGISFIDVGDTPAALVAAVTERQDMVNNGSIAVDLLNRPHIVANYNDDGAPAADNNKLHKVVRFHHHWKDEHGVWRHTGLPYYGTSRPKIVADGDAVYLAYSNYDRLVIAKATRAAGYADWEILKTWPAPAGFRYFGGVAIDRTRMRDAGVLSIYLQDEQSGASSSAIRVIEFDVGDQARRLVGSDK